MGARLRSAVVVSLVVLLAAASKLQAAPVAEVRLDMTTGQVCFPLHHQDFQLYYQICLRVQNTGPQIQLLLHSAVAIANPDLAALPVYAQSSGLLLPVVQLSDGRVFRDVKLAASIDAASRLLFTVTAARTVPLAAGKSAARNWNEALLTSIRGDLARPTVHARNLFHTSAAMYDAWAAFDSKADTYLLGKTRNGFSCTFTGMPPAADTAKARAEAISYASYGLLKHRFAKSPGFANSARLYDDLMLALGYDLTVTSRDYSKGSAAALGNHIADCLIAYGLQDGANEANSYASQHYQPVNAPFFPTRAGTTISDPDRWQPLSFTEFRDQNGNLFAGSTPPFLTPEWGDVLPFAMTPANLTQYTRAGSSWRVYHDPGKPPLLTDAATASEYQWSHELVALWSSHLDPHDKVIWDISPGAMGNNSDYPTTLQGLRNFYQTTVGGDRSRGHALNPFTGKAYAPNLVPRGDYTRVLAEFWADGPLSETPPGHWFTVLNHVVDDSNFASRLRGIGSVLPALEWDVKAYFALGGAMHDAAISAWGIKGYYDGVRPISAIRYMAALGQSSDPAQPNYNSKGLHLVPGYIELVRTGDALAGTNNENVGKIKLKAWLAHDKIQNGDTDQAGVGWLLAENWFPYQRPSFVTPPFAGYVSGHSTYSRAAAEVLTLLTGSKYFPGGLGEFVAKKNQYLVFEEGPSVDVVLQWATYQDAADQSALSRIWGGIHPPYDDMPGRRIGAVVGVDAFNQAERFFNGTVD